MNDRDKQDAELIKSYQGQTIPANMYCRGQLVPSKKYKDNFDRIFNGGDNHEKKQPTEGV